MFTKMTCFKSHNPHNQRVNRWRAGAIVNFL